MKNTFNIFFVFSGWCVFFVLVLFFLGEKRDSSYAYAQKVYENGKIARQSLIAQRRGRQQSPTSAPPSAPAPIPPPPTPGYGPGFVSPSPTPPAPTPLPGAGSGFGPGLVTPPVWGPGSDMSRDGMICIGSNCIPVRDLSPNSGDVCFGKDNTGCISSLRDRYETKNKNSLGSTEKGFCIRDECITNLNLADIDRDGIPTSSDNCPNIYNTGQEDTNRDGEGDACDTDDDGDGVLDAVDTCSNTPANESANVGGCSASQRDSDGDGVNDSLDNCLSTANTNQSDRNSNSIGDVCDDPDGDGKYDNVDNCPNIYNTGQEDTNRDGEGDACDTDDDGDGVLDAVDTCSNTPANESANVGGCSASQRDSDGDGVNDNADSCVSTYGTILDRGCPTPSITGWKGAYDSYSYVQCSWKGGARNYFEVTINAYKKYRVEYTDGGVLAERTCSSDRCDGAKYNNRGVGLSIQYPRRIKVTTWSSAPRSSVVYALCDVPDRDNVYDRKPYGWWKDGYESNVDGYSDTCDGNKSSYYSCPSSCSGYACEAGFNHVCVDVGGRACNRWGCSGAYVANVTCYQKFNHDPPY